MAGERANPNQPSLKPYNNKNNTDTEGERKTSRRLF